MKAVVVHRLAAAVELDWSRQFAGLDPDVKAQFSAVDWTVRVGTVFTIPALTWPSVVATVTSAAQAAGSGGVVIIASGHGGALFSGDPNGDGGMINWDPTDHDVDMDWTDDKVRKGLFWDDRVVNYLDVIPFGNPPTRKEEDEATIKKGGPNAKMAQKRHEAFDALQQIGAALKASSVSRLTFTVCTAGRATGFMKRLAKLCQCEVACFKQTTVVLDDGTFHLNPGKARLVLEADQKTPNSGTNIMSARVFSPNLDDSRIAFVASP